MLPLHLWAAVPAVADPAWGRVLHLPFSQVSKNCRKSFWSLQHLPSFKDPYKYLCRSKASFLRAASTVSNFRHICLCLVTELLLHHLLIQPEVISGACSRAKRFSSHATDAPASPLSWDCEKLYWQYLLWTKGRNSGALKLVNFSKENGTYSNYDLDKVLKIWPYGREAAFCGLWLGLWVVISIYYFLAKLTKLSHSPNIHRPEEFN